MQASPHKFTQLHFREKSPKLESAYRRKLREEQEKSTSGKRDSSVDSNKKKGRVSELKGVFQKFYTVLFIWLFLVFLNYELRHDKTKITKC